jgi:hypothetical protein
MDGFVVEMQRNRSVGVRGVDLEPWRFPCLPRCDTNNQPMQYPEVSGLCVLITKDEAVNVKQSAILVDLR